MNITHLTYLMLPHYLVKAETPKMHVNTSSPFNVNYIIAIKCIKLHCKYKNVLMIHIN